MNQNDTVRTKLMPCMLFSMTWALVAVLGCGASNMGVDLAALTAAIQKKTPREVRKEIVARLGGNSRHVGSGVDIEQWDMEGGVLTFHPVTGVYFEKDGIRHRLLDTTNTLKECIYGSYELSTQANEFGTHFWIGNLQISPDGFYEFTDSGTNLDERSEYGDCSFFIKNPTGTARVTYLRGLADDSVLELLKSDGRVAEVEFQSDTSSASVTYFIACDIDDMTLDFESDSPQSFQMHKEWVHHWNYDTGHSGD